MNYWLPILFIPPRTPRLLLEPLTTLLQHSWPELHIFKNCWRTYSIYLSVNTHSDISYIVNALAQHNVKPKFHHYTTAKWVLWYLAGLMDFHLQYKHNATIRSLYAYADTGWATRQVDAPLVDTPGTMEEASCSTYQRNRPLWPCHLLKWSTWQQLMLLKRAYGSSFSSPNLTLNSTPQSPFIFTIQAPSPYKMQPSFIND